MAHQHWQSLMTAAYDQWRANENWTYDDFANHLTGKVRIAVLLGNLNYQIGNGGLDQWVSNGYATKIHDVIAYLKLIGTDATRRVAKILEEVVPHVNTNVPSKGFYGAEYFKRTKNRPSSVTWSEEDEETVEINIEQLDDSFFEISEQFPNDVEEYLKQR